MIPAVRQEVHFAYVSDTNRRRFTKRGAYMAAAYAAIDRRIESIEECEGDCGCETPWTEYGHDGVPIAGPFGGSCKYHDYDYRLRVAKRLARWLAWRDKRFILGGDAAISDGETARASRMKNLIAMRECIDREMVRLDEAIGGGS